jgi:hypothetical protein
MPAGFASSVLLAAVTRKAHRRAGLDADDPDFVEQRHHGLSGKNPDTGHRVCGQ